MRASGRHVEQARVSPGDGQLRLGVLAEADSGIVGHDVAMQRPLLTIAAVLECLAGIALILLPEITISLLLGTEAHSDALMVGRIAGAALFSLGIACWWARPDAGGVARTGTLYAITLYNAGAGLLLLVFAITGTAGGVIAGIAGVLHLALASAFVSSLWQSARSASASSKA